MDKIEFYSNLVANQLDIQVDLTCLQKIAAWALERNSPERVMVNRASVAAQVQHMQRFNQKFLDAGINLFSQAEVEEHIVSGCWQNGFELLRDAPDTGNIPVFRNSLLERALIPGDRWDYTPTVKERFPEFITFVESLPVKEVRNAIISTFHPWQSTLPHSDIPTAKMRAFKDVLALLIPIDDGGTPIIMLTPEGKKLTLSKEKVGSCFTFNDYYLHTIAPRSRPAAFLRLGVVPSDEFFRLVKPTPEPD